MVPKKLYGRELLHYQIYVKVSFLAEMRSVYVIFGTETD
jgi:hypothetical protein